MARIVVVDTDADLLDLLREMFALRGWEIIPCRESCQALLLIEQQQPDVVLLDGWLDSPTAGYDLLDLLKRSASTRAIPVILCTAAVDYLESRDEWLRARCVRVLHKPFEIEDLYSAVEDCLLPPSRVAP